MNLKHIKAELARAVRDDDWDVDNPTTAVVFTIPQVSALVAEIERLRSACGLALAYIEGSAPQTAANRLRAAIGRAESVATGGNDVEYSDNSTTGADQGQDVPDDAESGWECGECGHIFFVASAWSGPEPECEPGVLCPECGAFVPTDAPDDD